MVIRSSRRDTRARNLRVMAVNTKRSTQPRAAVVQPPNFSPMQYSALLLTILGQPDLLRQPSSPSQMMLVNHNPHKWCLYCWSADRAQVRSAARGLSLVGLREWVKL